MKLDPIQSAAQAQFARQHERYGRGHILEDVADVDEALARLAHLPRRAEVLDVATGAGHTGLHLASLGHDVTLSDIAQPMLAQAENRAAERQLNVRMQQHPAESFPDESESFDLVTCRVAAHHFSSPAAFIAETARVLRRGGYLVLIDGSVEDGEREAEQWIHEVEKTRDPSHHRFLTPGQWSRLCEAEGLIVEHAQLTAFKQPDLTWYFQTAATTAENRAAVLELVANAPESARNLFQLRTENGKIVWWWRRLTLIARK